MTTKIELNTATGNYYFSLTDETGGWYNSSTSGMEAYSSGNYSNYAISMSQVSDLLKYEGDVPDSIPTGKYKTTYYKRSGGSPAIGDIIVGAGGFNWYENSQSTVDYDEVYSNGFYCNEFYTGGDTLGNDGTISNPASMSNCISLNNQYPKINRINIFGTNLVSVPVNESPSFYGVGESNYLRMSNSSSGAPGSYFENLRIDGNFGSGNTIYLKDCVVRGSSFTCGTIYAERLRLVSSTFCTSLNVHGMYGDCILSPNASGVLVLSIYDFNGKLSIFSASSLSGAVHMVGGTIDLDSSVTGGSLTLYGFGRIINDSSATVNTDNFVDIDLLSTFDSTTDSVDIGSIDGSTTAAERLALTAQNMVPGTVYSTIPDPSTTTKIISDDITEATTDHYKNRIILFTSGALTGQVCYILGYELVSSRGEFTVSDLTEAPFNDTTFIII